MKIRIISIACVTTAAVLLAACTAVYKNSDACEQLMRSKLAESSPDTLKVSHKGVGIDGSRVVVEGSIEHVVTASEVAASAAASAAQAAKAPRPASGAHGASAVSVVSAASGAVAASSAMAGVASDAMAASSAVVTSVKPVKPKKTTTAAAAECTFHGSTLALFSWLAPAKLASPPDPASEATE
ncbi:hypothetical protein [Paraburkholderia fungorum]|uniref:hypothetical protein n=1 Tax=Paraburkholderia fungorum TaxID=134537 RepID=UPI0004ABB585|nr:hypothetical protein [Paraburkholderia fungorum]KFX64106.1 hypothetical protein KBK24_0120840 [Burkholderia sp. K24]USX07631.1 hypothetical protein NHH62_34180 [Paraburkholderia fungorum]